MAANRFAPFVPFRLPNPFGMDSEREFVARWQERVNDDARALQRARVDLAAAKAAHDPANRAARCLKLMRWFKGVVAAHAPPGCPPINPKLFDCTEYPSITTYGAGDPTRGLSMVHKCRLVIQDGQPWWRCGAELRFNNLLFYPPTAE